VVHLNANNSDVSGSITKHSTTVNGRRDRSRGALTFPGKG